MSGATPTRTCSRIAAVLSRLGRYEESLALAREIGDDERVALCFHALGEQEREHGHYKQAERFLEEALVFFRRRGDAWTEAVTLGGLGDLDFDRNSQPPVIRSC